MSLDKYPKELTENRTIIEGNFVMSLWIDPDYYYDFDIDMSKDLLTEDGRFYYALGQELLNQGYKTFDDTSIYSYTSDKEVLRNGYDRRGGYAPIKEMKSILNIENIGVYYDNLCKNNLLMNLYDEGFNVINKIKDFNKMTTDQVYDYYDYKLNHYAINRTTDIKIEKLTIDDKFIEECNNGSEMGLNYGKIAHIMNYLTLGIPKSELSLISGHSGSGKTSWIFANIVLPVIENGHKVCIISNEQKSKNFKQMLLAMTLADMGYWKLSRKKIKQGNFNEEQKEKIAEAQKIIDEKYKDTLRFVKMYDYNLGKIKKIVKKLSKTGFELFLYDTMKGENLADGQVWQRLVEDSKQLFQLASKEDIAIVPTYQLALHTLNKRFLDASCLSNAKQIKEVFSEMILFRPIWDDEWDGEKYDIKPYNWKRDKNGKYTKVKQMIKLDRDKKYIVAFLDKTRNDEDKQTVVYEFMGAFNRWKEIGYCTVFHDYQ